jgi:hypothetical protein
MPASASRCTLVRAIHIRRTFSNTLVENSAPTKPRGFPRSFTAFREIVDNALDEMVTHGHGNRLEISYDPKTMVCSVADNGRGIPINFDEEEQQYAATVLLTETKAGRNFEERGNSRGMNGIGASVVNYACAYFNVEINRDGKTFTQRFVESEDTLVMEDPMIVPSDTKKTGTRIDFKLSSRVFKSMLLPERFVAARVYELALCYPQIKVFYQGKQIKTNGSVEKTLFGDAKPISFTVREEGFISHFWLVTNFFDDGAKDGLRPRQRHPDLQRRCPSRRLRAGVLFGLITALEPRAKRHKVKLVRGDIEDGLLLYNLTEMKDASFDSQNKTRLINESSAKAVKNALDDPDFFKKVVRSHPEWVDEIIARALERTQKKDAGDVSKLARKTLRQKVEDLHDACTIDRSKTILFLAEGKCLRDDTQVTTVRGGELVDAPLSDIEVGDLLLTHTNALKPVTAKWKKTAKGYAIKTRLGDVCASGEHRMLVHDRDGGHFVWVETQNLVAGRHQLVRSRVVDMSHLEEIRKVEEIEEGIFRFRITYGKSASDSKTEKCTPDHLYGVFNLTTSRFEKVAAKDLNPLFHAMILQKEKNNA